MTLRLRLLLVLLGIVACGLLAADAVTYGQLDNFLYSRTDQQLAGAFTGVVNTVSHCAEVETQFPGVPCSQVVRLPPDVAASIPLGTIGELLDGSGNVVGQPVSFLGVLGSGRTLPHLPAGLPGSSANPNGGAVYFSASGGGVDYRVLAQPVNPGAGTAVVAFPTTDIAETLGHLLWIEALVTAGVLMALGALAWWIVRRGLRPLDAMAATADAIAAGDLTQRVEDGDSRTEVGRLGTALNTMLGNIEQAFDARAASEERLRRFLADASHELRTPLTSIRGYAEMFDRGARDRPEDLAVSMRHIRDEADRMNELVNDLLLLARLDRERPLERQHVDLRALVGEAVEAARVSAPHRHITLSAPETLGVEGDASRLRQVVDNILTNADRYTPPGSPVEVRLHGDASGALVEVADHGSGVPAEDRQRIFEPFHRADPSRTRATGGVGLGLAIVAAIVRSHGGQVGVRTNEHGGATFWVHLPASSSAPPQPAPISAAADVADEPPPGTRGEEGHGNGRAPATASEPTWTVPASGRAASPAGDPEPGTRELPWHAP